MITRIGLVAGEIWNYLDENDRTESLERLVSLLGQERDMVLMSIGWLAREGHVVLVGDPEEYTVVLSSGDKDVK